MRFSPSLLRTRFLLVLLALTPFLKAEKLVVARSIASGEYLNNRMVDGKRQPQTYVFMAGRYSAGMTRDKSLERTSFRTIAERLALDLRRQEFFPAESLSKADLLLIVHWGVTAGRNRDSVILTQGLESLASITRESEQAQRNLDEATASGDLEGAGRARDNLFALASERTSEYQTLLRNEQSDTGDSAGLLGFSADLQRQYTSLADHERQKSLHEMTREERYFVIVMACDAPTLVNTGRLKRVWTLRASISSAGVNFPQALDRIGNIASQYFGTMQEGVTFDYTGDRKHQGSVRLDDLVVIGPVEP